MVNRLGEQNLAYVMLVLLEGLSGALFSFRVELPLFFQFFYRNYYFRNAAYLPN